MKCEWKSCKLYEVADIVDSLHRTPQYTEYGIPMLRVTDIKEGYLSLRSPAKVSPETYDEFTKKHQPKQGDIVISRVGTYGVFAYVATKDKFCLGQNTAIIIPHINKKFLYYSLISPGTKEYLNRIVTGSTQKTISLKNIKTIPLSVPDDTVQERIVDILSALDDKIELNNKINENLERQVQAIYQEWFGNVDTAKEQGTISDICVYSKDRVAVSKLDVNTYFSTENMLPGKAGAAEATGLPTTAQTTACHVGDTLISNIRPYFKKIVYCHEECGCSTDVLCFAPVHSKYSAYLYSTLYADRFFDFMVAGSKGTKMPRGDKKQIMTYPVALPTDTELESFNSVAVPILTQIQNNRNENKRLSLLRDTLLPKLMSGEINLGSVGK